jgi:hypothetical protein
VCCAPFLAKRQAVMLSPDMAKVKLFEKLPFLVGLSQNRPLQKINSGWRAGLSRPRSAVESCRQVTTSPLEKPSTTIGWRTPHLSREVTPTRVRLFSGW